MNEFRLGGTFQPSSVVALLMWQRGEYHTIWRQKISMKIIQESWTYTHWEQWCGVQTRNGSTRSLVRSQWGHQIGNTTAARGSSCSFHERLFERFASTVNVQRPTVQLSSRIRRALWDAAAVTCGLFAFGAAVWRRISSFFPPFVSPPGKQAICGRNRSNASASEGEKSMGTSLPDPGARNTGLNCEGTGGGGIKLCLRTK